MTIFFCGLILGVTIGIAMMCVFQINKDHARRHGPKSRVK